MVFAQWSRNPVLVLLKSKDIDGFSDAFLPATVVREEFYEALSIRTNSRLTTDTTKVEGEKMRANASSTGTREQSRSDPARSDARGRGGSE